MEKLALLARLEAKPGKEKEVAEFLKSALPLAEAEPGTIRWYALRDRGKKSQRFLPITSSLVQHSACSAALFIKVTSQFLFSA